MANLPLSTGTSAGTSAMAIDHNRRRLQDLYLKQMREMERNLYGPAPREQKYKPAVSGCPPTPPSGDPLLLLLEDL